MLHFLHLVIETALDLSQVNFVTLEKYNQITKGRAQRNDLLLTTRGSNTGKAALFNCEHETALINAQMLILRANPTNICPTFLFYQFRTDDFQRTLKAYSSGSAQPQLPIKSLKHIDIVLPPVEELRAIADILGTLDDKIELNRRMNETLEAMARALFKSWFVDFDPVRAKAGGRETGLPKSLPDLFPDSFEDSELGEIPKRWIIKPIGDLADVVGGTTPSTKELSYWEGGRTHGLHLKTCQHFQFPSFSLLNGGSTTRCCRRSVPDCCRREPSFCRREPQSATWPSQKFRLRSIRDSSR